MPTDSRRWLPVLAGVLVVAGAAGCGDSAKPVAVYDDVPVGADEIVAELNYLLDDGQTFASLGLTPTEFLQQYVRFQILLVEAKRSFQGLGPGEQARFALYQESLIHDALMDDIFVELPPPDEARVQALYEERAQDERRFSYIRCRSRVAVESAADWIRSGTSIEDALARLREEHPDGVEGGSLGFNRRDELPSEWEAAAWKLEPGEVSDVVASPSGTFTVLRDEEHRRTPMEVLRPVIERELREEARSARARAIDSQLLQEARFEVDSVTVELVASRFATHRDSAAARGQLGSRIGLPAFAPEELSRNLFTVMGQPFTVEAFLAEIGQFDTSRWTPGHEVELLHDIARRRAVSVALQRVAQQRGIYQRPEFQARLERKRSEFVMNSLLREVWNGIVVSDEDLRERIRQMGETQPGEATMEQLREMATREIQNARLQEFVDQLVARHDVQLYPERFADVLERFEAERLESATAPS